MNDMTPGTLREWAEDLYELRGNVGKHAVRLCAAADAWEDLEKRFAEEVEWDNNRADKLAGEFEAQCEEMLSLRTRLEEAKTEAGVLDLLVDFNMRLNYPSIDYTLCRLLAALAGEEKP